MINEEKDYSPPRGKPTPRMIFKIVSVPYSWPRRYNLVEAVSKQVIFNDLDKNNANGYINLYEKLYKGLSCVVIDKGDL